MTQIDLTPKSNKNVLIYNAKCDTFIGSEKEIKFDTAYLVKNTESGKSETFNFTHSTGPEFDSNTIWCYKSSTGRRLNVYNDPKITKILAANYLAAKTGKF